MRGFLARCQIAWSVLRGTDARAPVARAPSSTNDAVERDPEIPRYPPFLKGLPVATSAQILETQQDLITTFQNALAITDADYAALVPPLLERYAAFVHLLPASETHHHRGAGGLLRHGLEVAALAARASRGKLFALDRRPEERRVLEPRWHLAAFVAGLLHDVGKPVVDVSVFDRAGTSRWQPVDDTIVDWARRLNIDHYFLRWNAQRLHHGHEIFTASVFHQLLTPAVRNWLMDPDPLIWHTLGRVLAGSDTQSLLYHLMHDADRASVAQDLRENHLDPEALSLGVPIERYLIETMRALLREGTWTVNVPGAQVWTFHPGGLHLVWSDCAPTVVQRLAELGVPGIPRDPDTLAEILIDRQLAVPGPQHRPEHPVRYWRLAPACLSARRERPLELSFLRLSAPELLFSGVIPAPVPLVVRPGDPTLEADAESQHSASTEDRSETHATATAHRGATAATGTPDPAVHVKPVPKSSPWRLEPVIAAANVTASTEFRSVATTASDPASVAVLTPAPVTTPVTTPATTSAPTPDAARAWLHQHAPAGPALMQLSAAIAEGRIALPARPLTVKGQVFLPYPAALTGLDQPPEALLADLQARAWLVGDPLKPMLVLRNHDGVCGVWLTREVSRQMLALGLDMPVAHADLPALAAPPSDAARSPAVAPSPRPARGLSGPLADTTASAYARAIRERLLAHDVTLGPLEPRGQTLSVALKGPILDGAKRVGITDTALNRALANLPGAQVIEGVLTLGL